MIEVDRSTSAAGPILVLDPRSWHSLAAVRDLGRAGRRVLAAGSEERASAFSASSRYAEGYRRIPDLTGAAEPVRSALAEVIREHRIRAILACSDVTVARLRDLQLGIPTVPAMDAALDRVIDKVELARVCGEAGVMYPTTWSADRVELKPTDRQVIIKPRRTAVATADQVFSRTGAFVPRTTQDADVAFNVLRDAGLDPIVQVRVGRAFKVNVSIVRRDGRTSFRIAYRVLREYPVEGGIAAATQTLDADRGVGARALDAAERVCDTAGYAGLANVEFYGQADGTLCLIEVNARAWGSIGFPSSLGLQPAERAIRDALGDEASAPLSYRAGVRWHRPMLEAKWLMSRSSERLPRHKILASLRPWDVFDIVSASDPLPMAHAAAQALGRVAGSLRGVFSRRS